MWSDVEVNVLFSKHRDRLICYVRTKTGCAQNAEDIVHDAFAKLLTHMRSGTVIEHPVAFWQRVIANGSHLETSSRFRVRPVACTEFFRGLALAVAVVLLSALHGCTLDARTDAESDSRESAKVACSYCEPDLTRVAQLSSAGGPIVPSMSVAVALLPGNRFLVSYVFGPPQLAMFDAESRFLSLYDRRGAGPGELQTSPFLFVQGDTVVGLDRSRVLKFDSDLNHISTHTLDVVPSANAMVLPNGHLVVDHRLRVSGGLTHTVSLLDADGTFLTSAFPVETPAGLPAIAASSSGGFYAMHPNRSELAEYDGRGNLIAEVSLSRAWFVPWNRLPDQPELSQALKPMTAGLLEMGVGRVAVVTWVPKSEFWGGPSDNSQTWSSRIEVFDTATGTLIGSLNSDDPLLPVQGSTDLWFSTREGHLGHTIVDVWHLNSGGR